ncbi:methylamine utilization protein MauE [Brevibacillus agri BAB-2500]|nr:methylamine utilization protein MauE [Brevibacillus agri BAB-2500]
MNFEKHIITIDNYKVLPQSLIPFFAKFEITIEMFVSVLLYLGLFQKMAIMLMIFMLVVYSLAISANLLIGRDDISCGCNGVIGDHRISWWLVLRNFGFVVLGIWILSGVNTFGNVDFLNGGLYDLLNYDVILVFLISWMIILVKLIGSQFIRIKNQIRYLFPNERGI